jgi:hypothetical protein
MIIPISKPEAEQAKECFEEEINAFCYGDRIDFKQCEVLLEKFSEFCKIIGV